MDAQKRINKIIKVIHEQVEEELKILLGVEFALADHHNELVTKEECFEGLVGKQVVAKIWLDGEIEGVGALVIGIKDAIRLGGTLIMLPDNELEEVVGREEYAGETEDSYGEIANIIAGAYTKSFEELYTKTFRFVRKEQVIVVPTKVETASDEPIPSQYYYQVCSTMKLEGRQMGDLRMLMPAVPFGLQPEDESVVESENGGYEDEPEHPIQSETPEEKTVEETEEAETVTSKTADVPGPAKKARDPEKRRRRIDRLLKSCQAKLCGDLTGLIGVNVSFSEIENRFIDKEELFFQELQSKQIIADMDIVGELQGNGYFFTDLKDAINLGGTLIMLPPNELETVIADQEFNDDIGDAFGEVANIVSGVYTQVFEEQSTEKIRFVKKDLRQVVPLRVEVDGDDPIPDHLYYMSVMTLAVDGTTLGKARMVLPAEVFGIVSLDQVEESVQEAPVAPAPPPPPKPGPGAAEEQASPEGKRPSPPDSAKHLKRVNKLLAECRKGMQEEVSALLGATITFSDLENRLVTKEDFFFDVAGGKQVMTDLRVSGERQGTSYLFFSMKDAIHLGGVLIMLPPSELESVVVEEDFGDDSRDAFGEIANIVAGVYTGVFEEQYVEKLRFIKDEVETVIPMKVDIESDEPVPDDEYYLSSMTLGIDGQSKGKVHLLFPAAMLMVGQANQAAEPEPEPEPEKQVEGVGVVEPRQHTAIDILLISDDEVEAARIVDVAQERDLHCRKITFKDDVKGAITPELKAVYLVMREVNEQAFGIAIKVSSSCSLPLIAAGPNWTRSKVIKAVRYGINDILLTPASTQDVLENLQNNLVPLAA